MLKVLFRVAGTIFSAHPKTLSRAPGVFAGVGGAGAGVGAEEVDCLERSHEGSSVETRNMASRLPSAGGFSPGSVSQSVCRSDGCGRLRAGRGGPGKQGSGGVFNQELGGHWWSSEQSDVGSHPRRSRFEGPKVQRPEAGRQGSGSFRLGPSEARLASGSRASGTPRQ